MRGLIGRALDKLRPAGPTPPAPPAQTDPAPEPVEPEPDEPYADPDGWRRIPLVHEYHWRRAGASAADAKSPWAYALARWGGKMPTDCRDALVLGVDEDLDAPAALAESGSFARVSVIDRDEERLMRLVRRRLPGVECLHGDFDREPLPEGRFALIVTQGMLHTFVDLPSVIEQLTERLIPGGLLVAHEYAGPNRLQVTPAILRMAEALRELMPAALRKRDERERIEAPRIDTVVRRDPYRARSAEEVVPTLSAHMKVLESTALGGTVLAPLLNGFCDPFVEADEATRKYLETMLAVETDLIDGGQLASDTVFMICRHQGV